MPDRYGQTKRRLLPGIVRGDPPWPSPSPTARRVRRDRHDHRAEQSAAWTLNGSRWISNGGEDDLYLVYTRLSDDPGSKGIGALIVEKRRPGVSFGAQES